MLCPAVDLCNFYSVRHDGVTYVFDVSIADVSHLKIEDQCLYIQPFLRFQGKRWRAIAVRSPAPGGAGPQQEFGTYVTVHAVVSLLIRADFIISIRKGMDDGLIVVVTEALSHQKLLDDNK